jgi:hypothetical protein
MFAAIVIGVTCALALSTSVLLLRAWKTHKSTSSNILQEFATIDHWAEDDQREHEQLQLLSLLYRRWPETIRVSLDPADPLAQEIRRTIKNSPLTADAMLRIYRARPDAVQVTLDSRRHKMQVCDAAKLGIRVTVVNDFSRRQTARENARETWGAVSEPQR